MAVARYSIKSAKGGRVTIHISGPFLETPIQHSVPLESLNSDDLTAEIESIVERIAKRNYNHPGGVPDAIPSNGSVTFPARPQNESG